ncbi:MAG TPA: carbohydrate ABC transporter permease, partial [Chloroflexota bacterium]|nr:carbohydrate ABC transporter permease [Chloroflexota bacterium]
MDTIVQAPVTTPASPIRAPKGLRSIRWRRLLRWSTLGLAVRFAILSVFALFFVVPIIWLLLAPTKSDNALIYNSPLAFGDLQHVWLAAQHLGGWENDLFRLWIGNSLIYAFGGTAIVLATAIPAGYALALFSFPGRKLVLSSTLVVMIMPSAALVIPIFLEMNAFHLLGNVFSIILPFGFFPFGVYLAYIYFSTAIPRDLLDASRVDGCSELQTFRRVALPLSLPIVALVFFFSFVANWNNFFLPEVLASNSTQDPVQVGLGVLLGVTPSFNPAPGGGASQLP